MSKSRKYYLKVSSFIINIQVGSLLDIRIAIITMVVIKTIFTDWSPNYQQSSFLPDGL